MVLPLRSAFRNGALAFLATVTATAPAAQPDLLRACMDTTQDPGVDFFSYAVGGWLKAHPVPDAESGWGIAQELREQMYVRLRKLNEQAAAAPAATEEARKVGDFWTAAMDGEKLEKLGLAPLRPLLDRADAIRTTQDAVDLAFAWAGLRARPLFSTYVAQDEKDSAVMALHLDQGGLGMPNLDFYFKKEAGVVKVRAAYLDHLGRYLVLLGRPEAEAKVAAGKVLAFETELARNSRRLEALRDPQKNYHKMTPQALRDGLTPSIDWNAHFAAWKIAPKDVIVGQPEFFSGLEQLLAATPVAVLQDYLRLRLLSGYADCLSQPFQDEHFRFEGQAMAGQRKPRDRWKRVLDAQQAAMGMIIGKMFVQEYFPPAAKQRYDNLVEAIRAAYKDRIDRLDWMSDATKAKAQAKLAGMTKKVGYPDHWKDCSALVVGRASYAENMVNASRWRWEDMLAKLGKPVDHDEWHMTPQTYNAQYSPSNNEIVLPAAQFMVPGLLDTDLDDALVYGYAGGSTIGHEITHGFDDEGRQFDAKGNLADWWTPEDAAKFTARAEVMVKQFDAFEPLPGLHVNGKASLGENLADFGGILLGIDAFKKTAQYRSGTKIGGLTPMQRYFLGYTLGWMSQQRDEVLRMRLLSDVHAPAKYRVLGPLSNIPEFYEAFGIKPGQPMWRPEAERVKLW